MNYSYGKNNDKYNPNWISQKFGQLATDGLEQLPEELVQQGSVQIERIVKLVGMLFAVLILLTVALGIVLIDILG